MFNSNTNSFIGSIMNMYADIYKQEAVQDPNTGAVVRKWVYSKTIKCKIEPVRMRGSSKGDNKSFAKTSDMEYDEKIQLKMYSSELMSKRWRIENIKTSKKKPIFIEIDKIDQPNTIFEVTASHAEIDPFGNTTYFASILVRSEVQSNDPT